MRSTTCGKCGGAMAEGFLVDRDRKAGARLAAWYAGEPTRWWWGGLRLRGRARFEISARRCGRCGHLELFAAARDS